MLWGQKWLIEDTKAFQTTVTLGAKRERWSYQKVPLHLWASYLYDKSTLGIEM